MLPYEDPFTLSLLFHLNSEPWNNVAAYNDPHARMEFKVVGPPGNAIPLPKSAPSPLLDLLARRRSCRDFSPKAITLAELGAGMESRAYKTGPEATSPSGEQRRRPADYTRWGCMSSAIASRMSLGEFITSMRGTAPWSPCLRRVPWPNSCPI